MSESQAVTVTATYSGPADYSNEPAGSLLPGTVLGNKYALIEQIGRGGMGVVWKAKDQIADRLVALKFVSSRLKHFELEMERLRVSFKKIHALQHHAICPLYALENDEQVGYYLVMKYLEGETLDRWILRKDPRRQGLPMNAVISILSRVAPALDYAHANAVIHRDIKPANIFLEKTDGKYFVQIIDFGLADEIRSSLSGGSTVEQREITGTRPYMAPEQWRGWKQKAATDQYALAVVAYELLSGHIPFRGGGDVQILLNAVMNLDPEPIPTISDIANAVLLKALAKNPADRFTDCREFIAALSGMGTTALENMTTPPSGAFGFSRSSLFNWWIGICFVLLLVIGAFVLGRIWKNNYPYVTKTEKAVAQSGEVLAPESSVIAGMQKRLETSEQPVDSPIASSFSDIFEAAQKGTADDVRYFFDRGVNVNVQNNEGSTLLHIAAHHNSNVDVARYLVSQGADINARDSNNNTPLHGAAKFNPNTAVVRYLTNVPNIDVTVKNNQEQTPQDVADRDTKKTIINLAAERQGIPVKKPTGPRFTDIFEAANSGTVDEVRSFVRQGVPVDAQDIAECTPLWHAAGHNPDADVVQYLANEGADVNERDRLSRSTPLIHAALSNPNVEVLRFLVSRSVNVNAKDSLGRTSLHRAAQANPNVEILRYLVTVPNIDLNEGNDQGKTPLDVADTDEKKEILRNAGGRSGER